MNKIASWKSNKQQGKAKFNLSLDNERAKKQRLKTLKEQKEIKDL